MFSFLFLQYANIVFVILPHHFISFVFFWQISEIIKSATTFFLTFLFFLFLSCLLRKFSPFIGHIPFDPNHLNAICMILIRAFNHDTETDSWNGVFRSFVTILFSIVHHLRDMRSRKFVVTFVVVSFWISLMMIATRLAEHFSASPFSLCLHSVSVASSLFIHLV